MVASVQRSRFLRSFLGAVLAMAGMVLVDTFAPPLLAQPADQPTDGGTITLRSDIQEANAITGVITARGNVQIDYPTRQIHATSAQAQYFSNERRIILSGNVVILQEGNTLRAETVTYLIDEGQFVALPNPDQQVEATYLVPASETDSTPAPSPSPPPRPEPDGALNLPPVTAPSSIPGSPPRNNPDSSGADSVPLSP